MISKKRNLSTMEKIQNTAIKLFAQKGIGNVSVENILLKAKISRRTFYQYFKSKTDIIKTIPHIKAISDIKSFFEVNFPSFNELKPSSKLDFLLKELYKMIQSPTDFDLVFLEIIQREELLKEIKLTAKTYYQNKFDFVYAIFEENNFEDPLIKSQFFLIFLDGALLNRSLFQKHSLPYSFDEWFENSWSHMLEILNVKK